MQWYTADIFYPLNNCSANIWQSSFVVAFEYQICKFCPDLKTNYNLEIDTQYQTVHYHLFHGMIQTIIYYVTASCVCHMLSILTRVTVGVFKPSVNKKSWQTTIPWLYQKYLNSNNKTNMIDVQLHGKQ